MLHVRLETEGAAVRMADARSAGELLLALLDLAAGTRHRYAEVEVRRGAAWLPVGEARLDDPDPDEAAAALWEGCREAYHHGITDAQYLAAYGPQGEIDLPF